MRLISPLARSRPVAAAATLLFWFVCLPGCSRFSLSHQPGKGEKAAEPLSVSIDVYQTQGARSRDQIRSDGVITSLLYKKDDRWQVVGRSAKGSWTLGRLVPGEYRLAVAGALDEQGRLQPIKGPRTRDFKLSEGQSAYAGVVVKRTPTAVKVLIVVTIVVVVILIILAIFDGGDDVDIDVADVLAPIAAVPRLLITYPEVWLDLVDVLAPAPMYYAQGEFVPDAEDESFAEGPRIVSYSPAHGAKDVSRDANIRLEFDQPMSEWTLSPNTLYVHGSSSGEVVRGVVFEAEDRAAIVDPLRDFVPGETITVTVYGQSIATEDGEAMDESYRFSFQAASP